MDNYLIWPSVNDVYKSSKNTAWRRQVLEKSVVIMRFLKVNNLLRVEPFDANGELNLDLALMRSDVTDDGDAMFEKVIPSWQKARDKDGKINNLEILEKGLKKIREK